jgi:hypothetical protein
MVMVLGETTRKGIITRWFQKLRKNLYKNSIYFAHRQEYKNELKEKSYLNL